MNRNIEEMITGRMCMSDFLKQLKTDPTLKSDIRHLIPVEAAENAGHPFWRFYSYEAARQNHFDIMLYLERICKFDDTLGDNLNIHSTLCDVTQYYDCNIIPTTYYEKAFGLYLDTIADYYDGPEVRKLLSDIVNDALLLPKKNQQKRRVKELLDRNFHVENRNRPYWIHGGEWPMGVFSPMKFLRQTKNKDNYECTDFFFVDIDTGEIRTIQQQH